MKTGRQFIWNPLLSSPVRKFIQQASFPLALQIMALVGVGALAINGWGVGLTESSQELMTLRKTNLTTLFVWGLWWPGMIALALLGGRLWCTVCPMELVNRLADNAARRFGWPRAKLGRWLKAGWLIVLIYLALQILVAGFSIHRVPHYTSLMLFVLFGTAFFTGLLFRESRSFCKAFCPAGALLSVYGRYTPIQIDVQDPGVCGQCRSKDCVAQKNRYKLDKRSCPSLLQPFRRKQSDGCVLCFQCSKVCPYENVGFGIVRDTASSRRHRALKPFEALFVLLAAGFVAHEVDGEVKWLDEIFHTVPKMLHGHLPSIGFEWFEGLWFLVLFPLLLWSVSAGLAYLFGFRSGWKKLLIAAVTGAAPVVAVAHLAKAAAKISSWSGFLPLAIADPRGLETFNRLSSRVLPLPDPILSLPILGWIMLLALLLVFWRGWGWAREAAGESLISARMGLVTVTVFYASVLILWPWP
jgi:ferredoxin